MNNNLEFRKWLEEKNLDQDLKTELLNMSSKEIDEAFYEELKFGTGGIRGIMGPGINRINKYIIRKATYGFAKYLVHVKKTKGVAISYDNRHNSKVFAYEAAKVLAHFQIPTYIYENLRPTPMLSFLVRNHHLSGGIMITASHNPKEYNGFKAYNETGAQLSLDQAELVMKEIAKVKDIFNIPLGDNSYINYVDEKFDQIYLNKVREISLTNDKKKKIKIVYTPLHGAGGAVIPKFLKKEKYKVYPYMKQMTPDPNFSNTLSSNPEEKKSFIESLEYAQKIKANIVIATDPDADRLGIAVRHNNQYHLLNGNQTASIMLYYILTKTKKDLSKGYVFTTNVTTNLVNEIAKSFNVNVVTTLTGFKFIGEKAEKLTENQKYLFGCEESYGSLVSDFVRDKDAVQATYLLVELTNYLNNQKLTLIDYLNNIYEQFGYFYETTENIILTGIEGLNKIKNIMAYFKQNGLKNIDNFQTTIFEDLTISKRFLLNENKEEAIDLPKADVLKFFDEDNNWIVFRPSGTEPKLKIYYSFKDKDLSSAESKIEDLNNQILKIIKGI